MCKIWFASSVVLSTSSGSLDSYLCIRLVAEHSCQFVAQHVTFKTEKINIVLPDCMELKGLSAVLDETKLVLIIYSTFIWQVYCRWLRLCLQIGQFLCNLRTELHIKTNKQTKNTMFSCFHNKDNWTQFWRNSDCVQCLRMSVFWTCNVQDVCSSSTKSLNNIRINEIFSLYIYSLSMSFIYFFVPKWAQTSIRSTFLLFWSSQPPEANPAFMLELKEMKIKKMKNVLTCSFSGDHSFHFHWENIKMIWFLLGAAPSTTRHVHTSGK